MGIKSMGRSNIGTTCQHSTDYVDGYPNIKYLDMYTRIVDHLKYENIFGWIYLFDKD